MEPGTIRSFINKLEQGRVLCIENEGTRWYLKREDNAYIVSSDETMMVHAPFADITGALLFLVTSIGRWVY